MAFWVSTIFVCAQIQMSTLRQIGWWRDVTTYISTGLVVREMLHLL